LRIRCDILDKERYSLLVEAERYNKEKKILIEVIDTLKVEKRKN
jgi:hypothetical protein